MNERSTPRILVLGNCQAPGLTAALRALLPEALVEGFHIGPHFRQRAELTASLDTFDVVISHIRDGEGDELFDRDAMAKRRPTFVYMHPIIFTGFHPDIARVSHDGRLIEGPMSVYHSAIIAGSYALGLDPRRVPRLFNAYTYARLGYFDGFEVLKSEFLERHLSVGFDLAPLFDRGPEAGPFMYAINHPRIDILAAAATLAAARAGLVGADTIPPSSLKDDLADHARWPIYPEIGRRIGVKGSLDFVRDIHESRDDPSRTIQLPELVERYYQLYDSLPALEFDSPLIVHSKGTLADMLANGAGSS